MLAAPQRGSATFDAVGARAGALGGAHGQAPRGGHITNQPVLYKEEREHRSVHATGRNGQVNCSEKLDRYV